MNKREMPLFDEDYEGARFTYGMVYRPLQIGAQPKGWIIGSLRDHPDFRHGIIQYPRELSADEIKSYELIPTVRLED